jgi:hypothetical protein
MPFILSLAIALQSIKDLAPVRGLPVALDDDFLTRTLQDSAAWKQDTDQIIQVYRWRYTAARFLQVHPAIQTITKGDGTEFTRLEIPIQVLLQEQMAEDRNLLSQGYTIPVGYESNPCGVNCGSGGSSGQRRFYQSSVVFLSPRP